MTRERQRWKRRERRFKQIAADLVQALPVGRVARAALPKWQLNISFIPSERGAASEAVALLAAAVRRRKGRKRYVQLESPPGVEHAIKINALGRSVRLIYMFSFEHGGMIGRLDVAGA